MNIKPHIRVGAALIVRDGKYLIARRKPQVHMGGLWEFPGGKCEAGERPEECVRREVLEELGIEVSQPVYMMTHFHEYLEKSVDLIVFECSIVRGEPQALDCADFRWVKSGELGKFEFPAADGPIIAELTRRISER